MSVKDTNKIIVLGLAESGKSTIINAVIEGTIPERGSRYSATMNYERKTTEIFGKPLTLFDLGGQTSFLDRFTGELAEFVFSGVKAFIFVTDVSKFEEVSRAKYYLDLCLQNVDKYSSGALKYIFLHKIDLVREDMVDEISNNIREFLTDDYTGQIKYYSTSIYTDHLFKIMGEIFSNLSGEYTSLDPLLENFIGENTSTLILAQIYSIKGKPLTNISTGSNLDDISNMIHTTQVLIKQLTQGQQSPSSPIVFTIETKDNYFIIRYSKTDIIVVMGFSKRMITETKETFTSINNKVATFVHQLGSISLPT